MDISRRRFSKLFGFGIAGAVVENALPSSSVPVQAALPAPAMTDLAVDDAIEGELLGPEVQWADIASVPDHFPPRLYNPHIVTKEMVGLCSREELWERDFKNLRFVKPEETGVTLIKGSING